MTDLNASTDTVQAVIKVLQLAAILDDRCANPDKARIAAWSEQVERHQLGGPDLFDGLQAYYDSPSERAIQIGDLIAAARTCRRDRNEREDDAHRKLRADIHDQKAADTVQAIAGGFVAGKPGRMTPRLESAEYQLQNCFGRKQSVAAVAEYFAAKTEARKVTPICR